jgi:hypothetical protein
MRVVGTAGVVTALVGTGFGVGSSLELAVPATLVAAALAIASIAARARLEATQPH